LLAAGPGAEHDGAVMGEALALGHAMGRRAVSKVGATTGLGNLGSLRRSLSRMRRSR
jgi:hypothetical protein